MLLNLILNYFFLGTMESVELTFPMDSPDKEDNSPKEDTNQYIPWQPPTHRKKSDPSQKQKSDINLKCKEGLNNNVSQDESEYCLWEPDTDSASRRRRGRKESSKTPSDTDLRWSANSSIRSVIHQINHFLNYWTFLNMHSKNR